MRLSFLIISMGTIGLLLLSQFNMANATGCSDNNLWCYNFTNVNLSADSSLIGKIVSIEANVMPGGSELTGQFDMTYKIKDLSDNTLYEEVKRVDTKKGQSVSVIFDQPLNSLEPYIVELVITPPNRFDEHVFDQREIKVLGIFEDEIEQHQNEISSAEIVYASEDSVNIANSGTNNIENSGTNNINVVIVFPTVEWDPLSVIIPSIVLPIVAAIVVILKRKRKKII